MKKLMLGFSMALASLFMLASVASAQDWTEQAQYDVAVFGTDIVSGGQGVWINRWSNELADRWQRTYGWNPSMPIAIYVYSSGSEMANGLATFRGRPLTETERLQVTNQVGAITEKDVRPPSTGGTGNNIILVNVNSGQFGTGIGTPNWMNQVEAALVHEMAHLMVMDLAGEGGPMWLHIGIVNFLVQEEAPEWFAAQQRSMALNALLSAGVAPGVIALNNDWDRVTGTSLRYKDASYAVAVKTVQYMVPRVGLQAVLNVLKDSQTDTNLNGVLMRHAGWNLSQLDLAYRSVL